VYFVDEAAMRPILLLLSVSLLAVHVHSLTDPRVPHRFFPFGPDEGDSVLPVGDDASSTAISISTGFPFLVGNYSTAYVSIGCSFILVSGFQTGVRGPKGVRGGFPGGSARGFPKNCHCLSSITPRIDSLCNAKQAHPPH